MAILLSIVLCIRFYVFQFFHVSGPSMCPTLNMFNDVCHKEGGEYIFVNEFLYNFMREPLRGEIVVFKPPKISDRYIKRVIAKGGDTIEIRDGKVYLTSPELELEDYRLEEPYLSDRNQGRTTSRGRDVFEVPEGHVLLFGDNRSNSKDARQCFSDGGCDGAHTPFVPLSDIKGKAQFVVWPFWKWRRLENEINYLNTNNS